MYALTIDQRRSRSRPDRVPALLDALDGVGTVRAFERTAGDEVQALLSSPEQTLGAIRIGLEEGEWSIGLGVGPVERPLADTVRACRGPALHAARDAVEAAAKTSSPPVSVRASGTGLADEARDTQAVLRLIGWMIRTRNEGQWRAVRAARARPDATQQELAELLGITQQSVSAALRTSGWREESAADDVVLRLLRVMDLPSDRIR